MQFDNQKTRNVADVVAKILAGESAQPQLLDEKLHPNQQVLDVHEPEKDELTAKDFEMLRKKKKMKEETELTESHFKVGDEVICKASGMEGEVVKVDPKEEGKYYTVKREDGKMVKYAPDELKKEEEEKEEMKEAAGASKSKEEKFHMSLDKLVHKTFGHSPAEKKEKMKKEETEIDEAMFPGTKEYEKKFGQSPQQKLKKKGDTVPTSQGEMKKTEKGVMHTRRFSEMVSAYQEQGLKFVASLVKEEPTQDEYDKEIKKAQNKSEGKEKAEVAKASVQAVEVQKEQTHTKIEVIDMTDPDNIQKSEIDLEERSLTEPEMKKREEIVKSMKKKMPGFKERYGERAKEVAYATATKIAKEKA